MTGYLASKTVVLCPNYCQHIHLISFYSPEEISGKDAKDSRWN